MSNRLAGSNSPYLLQHAGNPVDWQPWGPEALRQAQVSDKPILLSIGYSACHWCHVMAHESFEDEAIAAKMNGHFVTIKVDREERPDIDAAYMEAVQAMTGRGGWPLTVFLTPDGLPFYGGTYFPPLPRAGLIAFPELLDALAAAWRERRTEVEATAGRLAEALRGAARGRGPGRIADGNDLQRAAAAMLASHDAAHGGFGTAPKFPQAPALSFLDRWADHASDSATAHGAREAVDRSLDAMAEGGLFDQLGGGFHRYCVDADWTVPHFEKMLYDSALLVPLYVGHALRTGGTRPREVVEATLTFLATEMRHPAGAFFAAQDADQEGEEGSYFVWTPGQLADALGETDAAWAGDLLGVRPGGNYEHGASVLSLRRPIDAVEQERWRQVRGRLASARNRRSPPDTDDKIVCSWNGLAILAFAQAGMRLKQPGWINIASEAATFVLDRMRTPGGELAHVWRRGQTEQPAFLDDVAAMALACQALHAADGQSRWGTEADTLVAQLVNDFLDPVTGRFHRSGPRHEQLFVHQTDAVDGPSPSGGSLALRALIGQRDANPSTELTRLIERGLGAEGDAPLQAPLAFAGILESTLMWCVASGDRGRAVEVQPTD